jgi:uncharacterized protein
LVISRLTSGLARTVEDTLDGLSESVFDTTVRLGVTGLSRAGKTVFITSLVNNLLVRSRLPQLAAAAEGRLLSSYLQPQPDHTLPRFAYEDHLAALTAPEPHWPESTRSISTLRLSLRVAPRSFLSGLTGNRTVHLDIVDYPGEWLLDLPLMDQSFEAWSRATLEAARSPGRLPHAEPFLAALAAADPAAALDESDARGLAAAFTAYLAALRASGLSAVAPGRFLMPGDLEGSPALTFCPLEKPAPRILLLALARLREALRGLQARRRRPVLPQPLRPPRPPGRARRRPRRHPRGPPRRRGPAHRDGRDPRDLPPRPRLLAPPILGRRIDRILFAATKADHLHHSQHARLSAITNALVLDARSRADFRGAKTGALALASLRATVEASVPRNGTTVDVVRGRLIDTGEEAALFPGRLPEDPAALLSPARQGAEAWADAAYRVTRFAPPKLALGPEEALPHIRLDRALEFLIGDKLA